MSTLHIQFKFHVSSRCDCLVRSYSKFTFFKLFTFLCSDFVLMFMLIQQMVTVACGVVIRALPRFLVHMCCDKGNFSFFRHQQRVQFFQSWVYLIIRPSKSTPWYSITAFRLSVYLLGWKFLFLSEGYFKMLKSPPTI